MNAARREPPEGVDLIRNLSVERLAPDHYAARWHIYGRELTIYFDPLKREPKGNRISVRGLAGPPRAVRGRDWIASAPKNRPIVQAVQWLITEGRLIPKADKAFADRESPEALASRRHRHAKSGPALYRALQKVVDLANPRDMAFDFPDLARKRAAEIAKLAAAATTAADMIELTPGEVS